MPAADLDAATRRRSREGAEKVSTTTSVAGKYEAKLLRYVFQPRMKPKKAKRISHVPEPRYNPQSVATIPRQPRMDVIFIQGRLAWQAPVTAIAAQPRAPLDSQTIS